MGMLKLGTKGKTVNNEIRWFHFSHSHSTPRRPSLIWVFAHQGSVSLPFSLHLRLHPHLMLSLLALALAPGIWTDRLAPW
jgi:hypothetical protein